MPSPPDVIHLPDQRGDVIEERPAASSPPQEAATSAPKRKTVSGSAKRSRAGVMRFRLTHAEYAEIAALAKAKGMEVGSYVRAQALAEPDAEGREAYDLKRPNLIPFRVSEAERERINALAERTGLSSGSYMRARSLNRPVTLTRRGVPIGRNELARLRGLLGNVASNINQIARQLNSDGAVPSSHITQTLDRVNAVAGEMLRALGREPL